MGIGIEVDDVAWSLVRGVNVVRMKWGRRRGSMSENRHDYEKVKRGKRTRARRNKNK